MDKKIEPASGVEENIDADTEIQNNLMSKTQFKQGRAAWHWWVGGIILAVLFLIFGPAIIKDFQSKSSNRKEKPKITTSEQDLQIDEMEDIDPDNPPQFIQADFVELDKVYSVSKFRSGVGHDYSTQSPETCRSMKHYFSSIDPNQPNYKSKKDPNDVSVYPPPTLDNDVKIFSPVDGTLEFVDFDQIAFNHELSIILDAHPNIRIRLQHVQTAPGVKEGKVKAGQLVGLVLANQSFDLAIEALLMNRAKAGGPKTGYISYFAAMPDIIFEKYQARGIKNREEFIITREYRDAHPYGCHGKEVFDENYLITEPRAANIVDLSGYAEVIAKIKE